MHDRLPPGSHACAVEPERNSVQHSARSFKESRSSASSLPFSPCLHTVCTVSHPDSLLLLWPGWAPRGYPSGPTTSGSESNAREVALISGTHDRTTLSETNPELREADRQQGQLVVVQVQMLKAGQVSQVIRQTGELVLTQIHLHQVRQVAKLWLCEAKEKGKD